MAVDEGRRGSFLFPLLGWVVAIGGIGFAVWNFYEQQDFVAAVAIGLIGLGACNGFRRGMLGIVVTSIAIVVATQFARPIGMGIDPMLSERLGTTGMFNRGLSILTAGFAVYLGFNVFVSSMLWVVLAGRETPSLLGRAVGALAGVAQWSAIVLLTLSSYHSLKPTFDEMGPLPNQDMWAPYLESTCLGPYVDEYNPFAQVVDLEAGPIQDIQSILTEWNSPSKLKRLIAHADMRELRQDPKVDKAISALIADPDFRQLVQSKTPWDTSATAQLLQNAAVMDAWDHPKIRKKVKAILFEATIPDQEKTTSAPTPEETE